MILSVDICALAVGSKPSRVRPISPVDPVIDILVVRFCGDDSKGWYQMIKTPVVGPSQTGFWAGGALTIRTSASSARVAKYHFMFLTA